MFLWWNKACHLLHLHGCSHTADHVPCNNRQRMSYAEYSVFLLALHTVTYSGFSIHDGTLLHSKSQYTTVKHSRKLLERTYTSNLYGTGTLTPIEFFQQDLLWQSSNTRFQTHQVNPSSGYRSTCTPQQHFGV
jgi:hypothetical protein